MNLCSKLKNDLELLERYNEIFIEQKELGMIEEVSESSEPGKCHYLLHHPVIREDKDTTKVRIVFDASAKGNGRSLNECVYKGPQLTPLIFDILLRFRAFVTVLTTGIEKTFLQISINPNDRDYLRFLWFEDVFAEVPKIVRNRFAGVLFGMTSSPYLLNGTVQKYAKNT